MAQIRRVRRRRDTEAGNHIAQIEALMKSIAIAEDTIADLDAKRKTELHRLHELMTRAKETSHECGELVAKRVTPAGKSSTCIDPYKFYKAVDEKDFFDSVVVSVTKARGVLSERALSKVSRVTPGVAGPETVKIMRIKKRG